MKKLAEQNSWVAAGLSWIVATVLVVGIYYIYLKTQGESLRWTDVRNAALAALALAVLRGWRDRKRDTARDTDQDIAQDSDREPRE